jgi:tetratricopeptide (TPR) repeat protein
MQSFNQMQTGQNIQAVDYKKKSPLLLLLIIIAATLAALAIVIYLNLPSPRRSITNEINKDNLMGAYDIYLNSKPNLNKEDFKTIAENITPKAEKRCNQIISRLKQEASESEAEWSEVTQLYTWMNEINPKPEYESRRYFAQARIDFARKNYNSAVTNYRRCIEIDPTSAMAFNGLGRAYWNLKDGENAKENYRRAAELEPNWIYPHINLGALYLELNNPAGAENALQKALTIDSRKATAHYFLGHACEKMSRWCEAYRHYTIAIENAGINPSGFSLENARNRLARLANYGCL